MNPGDHISTSEPAQKRTLHGWAWFVLPVLLNLFVISTPSFDGNVLHDICARFSIPYLVIATVIGIRRGSRMTVVDFLFLVFGNEVIISLLWYLNPPPRSLWFPN